MVSDTYTDSALRDKLSQEVEQETHIKTMSQQFTITLDKPWHKKLVSQLKQELPKETQTAVSAAVVRHFTHMKAHKLQDPQAPQEHRLKQAISKLYMKGYLADLAPNKTEIKISKSLFPHLELSKFTSSHTKKVIQTDVTIVGPSNKMVYVESVQTPEGLVKFNQYNSKKHGQIVERIYNDYQVLLVEEISDTPSKELRKLAVNIYGDFVGQYATGDKIRVTGIYDTDPHSEDGDKSDLVIESINIEKLEENPEYHLSLKELDHFKQLATDDPEEYLTSLTKSFAPHIYGNHIPKLGI